MVEGGGFEPPKLARQIYSLIPLATREPLRKRPSIVRVQLPPVNNYSAFNALADNSYIVWSWREESNPRPADYKSAALPTELRQRRPTKNGGAILLEVGPGRNRVWLFL